MIKLDAQQLYIVNHKNLYSQITKKLPPHDFAGFIEIIRLNSSKKCKTVRYVKIFKSQRKFFFDAIKSIKNYLKNTRMDGKRRCVYQMILDTIRKGQNFISKWFNTKINWAKCSMDDNTANRKFFSIWQELFYTFNKKIKTKNVFFAPPQKAVGDSPFDSVNMGCPQNAPKMFCEFIGFFLHRANLKPCTYNIYCIDKKVNIDEIIKGLYERFLREYHGFNEFCSSPKKVDYLLESKNSMKENLEENGEHGD